MPTLNIVSTIFQDVLDRVVLIDQSITGVAQAQRSFYQTPGQPPYPKILNKVGQWSVSKGRGEPFILLNLTIQKLILGGAVGSGYVNEFEDNLNLVYAALMSAYLSRPRLEHPETGEPLQYIQPSTGVTLGTCTGTIGVSFDPEAPERFFGAELPLSIVLLLQQGRV
jgi:hypothetical protein